MHYKTAEPVISFRRDAARKLFLRQILEGKMILEGGASFLVSSSLEKIFRVNVVARALIKEKVGSVTNVMLDDGTGQVAVRFFEPSPKVELLSIGSVLLVIAKPRIFNREIYLSPEIIRPVRPEWMMARKKELLREKAEYRLIGEGLHSSPAELVAAEEIGEVPPLPKEKIIRLIQKLDQGSGVLMEEIMEQLPLEKAGALLEKLLEQGILFQNAPGKVKIL